MGKKKLANNEFIKKANEMHNNKYTYGKSEYVNCDTKICITCPIHGEFYQMPKEHLPGHGHPKCRVLHFEQKTETCLKQNSIQYMPQKRFNWLVGYKGEQIPLDFFLSEYNIVIECQGIQHYMNQGRGYFTQDKIKEIKQRDILKNNSANNTGYVYTI